jgi:2-oxoglutarate ferredoxin oxidoreductase subunit alpha
MCKDLSWDDAYRPDRGKVLTKEQIEALPKFHRYLDVDDDSIPYRTLPGVTPKGAYFTRGSGHNQYGGYTEDSAEYQVVVDRLLRKFKRARALVPPPVVEATGTSEIGLVAVGSCRGAVTEARDILAKRGIPIDYMRIKAFPFTKEVETFMASHEKIFVVEQNRDGQLRSLLTLETDVPKSKLHSILHYSGLPMTSKEVVEAVLAELGDAARRSALASAQWLP